MTHICCATIANTQIKTASGVASSRVQFEYGSLSLIARNPWSHYGP